MHVAIDVEDLLENASDCDKKKIKKKAYACILLNLSDKGLKNVSEETISQNIFFKLDFIYFDKSLYAKVQLKHYYYLFKMNMSNDLEQNIDNFKRLSLNLMTLIITLAMRLK